MSDDLRHRLDDVRARIRAAGKAAGRAEGGVALVAVSKMFEAEDVRPVLEAGQRVFGENRVQEAQGKWPRLKADFPDVELHLIGPLQTNKAKDAVALFDVIETLDRDKLAREIAKAIGAVGRTPRLLVQVNTGGEDQKAGIDPRETQAFLARCRGEHGLEPEGLMCIPPIDEPPAPHFALLRDLAERCGLATLSMGMSGDYEEAVAFGATHVRVGSAIFGERPRPR